MLLGIEIGAALTALEPLGHRPDRPELRDRAGRDERAPAVPVAQLPASAVGDAQRRAARARPATAPTYPLTPAELATRSPSSSPSSASAWSAAAAARRRSTSRRSWPADRGPPPPGRRDPRRAGGGVAVPARAVPAGRQRADDRRAHQRQRLQGVPRRDAGRALAATASRSPAARPATARTCSTCASTTSAATAPRDMREAGRPVRHRVHAADHAGLDRAARDRGRAGDARRPVRRSTRSTSRTATGPESRYARIDAARARARRRRRRADHRRGGPGPHRARRRSAIAERLIDDLTGNWGMRESDILVDCLTFTHRHRPGGEPPRRAGDDRGHPASSSAATRTCRPRWACPTSPSGSNPAARQVLNSVFLHECAEAGLDSRDRPRVQDPADVEDRRRTARGRARPRLRPRARRREATTRCSPSCELFEGVSAQSSAASRARGTGRAPAGRTAAAPHHRRRAQRPRGRPGRGDDDPARRWRSSTTRCSRG